MSEVATKFDLLSFTTDIASAYVANNTMPTTDIPALIQQVYTALCQLAEGNPLTLGNLKPAVPVNKSVTDDYIVCLEDGKKLQMLKRHLKSVYNMSVDEYRKRWGLGPDYPVVAPNYARRRSQIAKSSGLGVHGRRRLAVVASSEHKDNSSRLVS